MGRPLSNFADRSFSAQLRYQAGPHFAFGGTATYESGKCAGQPDTGAGFTTDGRCSQPIPGFAKYDAFASYRFDAQFEARLNVLNVTDKAYYLAAYRSGSFVYLGDARAWRLTLNYEF